jgi:hypothetical protein
METFICNFIKIGKLLQELKKGYTYTQTHGNFISVLSIIKKGK